ncbi:hypothetical protein DBR39_01725 [Chryseobacterium sp. KBW03]|uniref:hypothetical protein n=1 Tax=Chryseobacterium sp. KBW03 TaxID=2153362 RepID=UPI000F5A317F|nr:hypothetical protein [Chryseobacterium sp. KBW03]RQO42618.1 hypothetical protein DBR39_01725 [Chryseobacterium sp. KBW03]
MILLISVDNDTMTDEICTWLSYQNKEFVRLSENQHINKVFFDFKNNTFKISIGAIEYKLEDFKSVFYRNGGIYYNAITGEIDSNLVDFYNSELKSISEFIYYYFKVNEVRVFGNLFTKEVNKLEVLLLAKSLGLKIPDTYILSELNDLEQIDISQTYITKAVSEMKPIVVENDLYLNYTHEIDLNNIHDKKESIIPSLIQRKIDCLYEIRAFFFEKQIWAIATFDFSGNVDIRNIKEKEKKYLPLVLPLEQKRKILKLAKKLNLKCGTVDLLKSDKDYYFLEVNPLGQFHQVSYYGNYQIEKRIADLL